jgi:dTDP-4-amino-4,6-dideoxygalactose transaminase
MITVSRTLLPKLSDYNKYLKRIWANNWLTNDGELVRELEKKLEKYWGAKNVICVDHGTSALILLIKALDIKDYIYTSPYSFIATVSAPVWLGVKPIFVDLNEEYGDPALVTHVYGIPSLIKNKNVIYDASHAFAVKHNGKYIVNYGLASAISFHAVKTFQTVEGGAVVTNNDELADKIRWMRNHGFKSRYTFYGTGINCKMSEFHAAMGLCSLPLVEKIITRYAEIIKQYNEAFNQNLKDVTYYPLWYPSETKLLQAIEHFEKESIFVRRYFYPPLNRVFDGKPCPLAEDSMSRVLALPLYYELSDKDVNKIISIAKDSL